MIPEPVRWLNDTEQRAWRSLVRIVNRGLPRLERRFRACDMVMVEYGILAALSEAPQATLRLGDLAAFAESSPSRLSHRLHRLCERGDVTVAVDADDARVRLATLTASGRARLDALAADHASDVAALMFDPLTPTQAAALADALATIADALDDEPGCATEHGPTDAADESGSG